MNDAPPTPIRLAITLALALAGPLAATAALAAENEAVAAQRAAMAPLAIFDGTWRGPATVLRPDGTTLALTQTERVGPMLGGALRVIEGRGYGADGALGFNAMAVLSFDLRTKTYDFRSYADGRQGDFPLEVRADGFTWSIQAGPATIRYTATVKDGQWIEVGERLLPGQPALKLFEMTLQRVGDTGWPQDGALPPK